MIRKMANDNGYYNDVLDNLKYRLTENEGKWCKAISDPSGRDFYEYLPIEFLADYEREVLKQAVLEDVESDYPEDEFNRLWENILKNADVIAEMTAAGYRGGIDMGSFREYLDDLLYEDAFESFVKINQGG